MARSSNRILVNGRRLRPKIGYNEVSADESLPLTYGCNQGTLTLECILEARIESERPYTCSRMLCCSFFGNAGPVFEAFDQNGRESM